MLETKAPEPVLPIHTAQLLAYLRISGLRAGLFLNFDHVVLKGDFRRFVT